MAPASIHVAQARGTTAAVLRQWALPDAPAEDAQLVVSELVTNAISHGSGAVGLRVLYGNHQLRIEVTDGSTTPAKRRRAGGCSSSVKAVLASRPRRNSGQTPPPVSAPIHRRAIGR
nr:ATP-binding protein [Streptomyces sp. Ncost-T10-10d]